MMTLKQAHRKADELWGKGKQFASGGGYVCRRPTRGYEAKPEPPVGHRYDVGYIVTIAGISMFSVEGSGKTWEAAFADAEEKRLREKARMDEIRAKQAARAAQASKAAITGV